MMFSRAREKKEKNKMEIRRQRQVFEHSGTKVLQGNPGSYAPIHISAANAIREVYIDSKGIASGEVRALIRLEHCNLKQ